MNVYMAPEAEVIELNVNATLLANSMTGELGGQGGVAGSIWQS